MTKAEQGFSLGQPLKFDDVISRRELLQIASAYTWAGSLIFAGAMTNWFVVLGKKTTPDNIKEKEKQINQNLSLGAVGGAVFLLGKFLKSRL